MQIAIYDLANCGRGRSLSYDIQEERDNCAFAFRYATVHLQRTGDTMARTTI